MSVLDDDLVRAALSQAWQDSCADTDSAHEEGGYVLRAHDGSLVLERWPSGEQEEILVPDHSEGLRNGLVIVATFHTHPNPEPDFQQEPGLTDIRAVRDDVDLHSPEYEGEYVISRDSVYRVLTDGTVECLGSTPQILGGP